MKLRDLERQLGDAAGRTRWHAIDACVRLGKPAVPMLIRVVAGEDPFRRDAARAAATALTRLGPAAVSCLEVAQKLLREGDDDQRDIAFDLIGRVGPHDPENAASYRQLVYDQLHRRDKRGGRSRTDQLVLCMIRLHGDTWPGDTGPGGTGQGAAEAIEHLRGASAGHLEMALDSLFWYRGDTGQIVEVLRELLTRKTLPRRTTFKFSGGNWGWSGSTSNDRDHEIRTKIALLLLKFTGGRGLPAAAHVYLAEFDDPSVRRRSVLQLGSLGAKAIGTVGVKVLERATEDQDKLVAWDAITALGMLGPAAARAIPRLEAIAKSKDRARSARAGAALRMIRATR